MTDDPETIEQISQHPIYGIVEYYGRIAINDQWYQYDRVRDRLVRCTTPAQQELISNE